MCQHMNPYESRELANSIEKNLASFEMLQSHCGGTEETANQTFVVFMRRRTLVESCSSQQL